MKKFDRGEIYVIGLLPKKLTILHSKFCAGFEYLDHTYICYITLLHMMHLDLRC